MTEITRRPTRRSSAVAGAAAVVAVLAAGVGAAAGLALAALGAVALAGGLVRGHRTAVDVGAAVLFFAVVAGGLETAAVEPTVVGTIATVIAWDCGHGAIDLGEQLGREAPTGRLEAVHAVSSLIVGLLSGTVGYGVYLAGAGGQPVGAVTLLVLAAAFVTIGLGTRRRGPSEQRGVERPRGR